MIYRLIHADVLDGLRSLADCSIDSVVTDPPYELGFMGKAWDSTGIANSVPMWREALRVLKPGGHLLAFGGSRTYHRLACAVEDAGFEIRDQLQWLYGSGFPKSLDVSKVIDKAAGAAREVIGTVGSPFKIDRAEADRVAYGAYAAGINEGGYRTKDLTEPATDAARQWEGWGTALKPAHEPIVLARKPFRGTVAANVLQHGTGALNVDGCRIATGDDLNGGAYQSQPSERHDGTENWRFRNGGRTTPPGDERSGATLGMYQKGKTTGLEFKQPPGRWPANVILDEEAAVMLDEQSGELTSGTFSGKRNTLKTKNTFGQFEMRDEQPSGYADPGGASRFFYTAKASRSEREEGLDGEPDREAHRWGSMQGDRPHMPEGYEPPRARSRNHHPTVKPVDLMQWLVRLVTPRGGTVLDPFTGSGTTGMAAIAESMDFIGIEREAEYIEIARRRIASIAPLLAREVTARR